MNFYELMVIFSSNLSEEEVRDQSLQVEELLKNQKADLHLVDHWGKRKLAYTIKKQRQGYYDWFYAEMDPSRVSEVDRKLKMSETILRFMMLKMEKAQVENMNKEITRRAENARLQAEAAAAAAAAPPPPVAPAEEPVPAEPAATETVPAPAAEAAPEPSEPAEEPKTEEQGTEPVPES